MDKLKEFIKKNYRALDGSKTEMNSSGNETDVFGDGMDRGYACALNDIANLLEIEIAPLAEQDYE